MNSTYLTSSINLISIKNSIRSFLIENYQIILEKNHLIEWMKKLQSAKSFVFEIETDSNDTLSTNLIGLYFAIEEWQAAYIPLKYDCLNFAKQLKLNEVLDIIKPVLVDDKIQKIGKNTKFNYSVMKNYDIILKNMAFDIRLESYILNSIAGFGGHDIASLAKLYFNSENVTLKKIINKNYEKPSLLFSNSTSKKTNSYIKEDVKITLLIHNILWPQIEAKPKLKNIFQQIEIPLVPVLAKMEQIGVLIDKNKLAKQSQEISNRLIKIEKLAYIVAEQKFNLFSPKELQFILFKKLQLPVIEKTSCGLPSTNEIVLEYLSNSHELPNIILQYRRLSKLKSTYIDKLPMMINLKTKRIHTSYHQTVTSTGRLSSRNPNLQNIPIRTKEGRRIRQAFIAREGYKILSADYSQIELRILAHFSKDQRLLNAFAEGQDIHSVTAADIFNIFLKDVTNEQRRTAKAINFGLIYGMSSFGLSRQLKISLNKAKFYIDCYFKRYPGILSYMEFIRKKAAKKGYVETLEGRRLYLPDINSNNTIKRKASEREAINASMQGTAADIIKRAMISLDKWIETVTPNLYMLIQVHDELVFEVKKSALIQSQQKIRQLMEQSVQLAVNLKVDIGVGDNWDEAH